ncbi:hypothetical protein Cme02nite_27320 [Catellatospora methionotrophica]|uniref:Uncharacterized protein n=1 Tax=Catellatospora methionotrophica TaxID=121620 RepID=A0A8J3LKI3_9ACTN|nr:hypothetical protein Cme02nite_27320 [Catellatospora methionotrophica]
MGTRHTRTRRGDAAHADAERGSGARRQCGHAVRVRSARRQCAEAVRVRSARRQCAEAVRVRSARRQWGTVPTRWSEPKA